MSIVLKKFYTKCDQEHVKDFKKIFPWFIFEKGSSFCIEFIKQIDGPNALVHSTCSDCPGGGTP